MFDISPIQIIIVLAIALLVFGPKRLPDMGRSLGKGIRDFKGGLTGEAAPDPVAATAPTAAAAIPAGAGEPTEPTFEEIIKEAATPEPVGADERPPARAA